MYCFMSPFVKNNLLQINITFSIFVASMDSMNVVPQMPSLQKRFATRITFVIFAAFMNCLNVLLQRSCFRK